MIWMLVILIGGILIGYGLGRLDERNWWDRTTYAVPEPDSTHPLDRTLRNDFGQDITEPMRDLLRRSKNAGLF